MHVAFGAAGPCLGGIMKMVLPGSVFGGHMTTVTQGVPTGVNLPAVGFVAILANNPCLIHLALKKGGIYIDFILNLSVSKIEILLQQ
jgi:hypothetical protein